MFLVRNRDAEPLYPGYEIFHELDRSLFPADGRFLEIFQLWVHPSHRRAGLATALKRALEAEAGARGIGKCGAAQFGIKSPVSA
jgi:ribosomal protein S18 acetylase RimI-like enzyme